jgi:hypothetical protein
VTAATHIGVRAESTAEEPSDCTPVQDQRARCPDELIEGETCAYPSYPFGQNHRARITLGRTITTRFGLLLDIYKAELIIRRRNS